MLSWMEMKTLLFVYTVFLVFSLAWLFFCVAVVECKKMEKFLLQWFTEKHVNEILITFPSLQIAQAC